MTDGDGTPESKIRMKESSSEGEEENNKVDLTPSIKIEKTQSSDDDDSTEKGFVVLENPEDVEKGKNSSSDEEKETKMQSSSSSKDSSNSSSTDEDNSNFKTRKQKLKTKYDDLKVENEELIKKYEELENKIQEETDAKERVEGYLKELQDKHEETFSKYEALQTKSNNNEEYCIKLENKIRSLNEELPDKDSGKDEDTPPNENENNDTAEVLDLRNKVTSQTVLIEVYMKQIDQLTREKDSLEGELTETQQSNHTHTNANPNTSKVDLGELEDLNDEERSRLLPIIEQQVKNRLQDVENCLVDQSQLHSHNQVLDSENTTLQQSLQKYQKKYAEAIVTLKEVQDAFGMRDKVLEKYKEEMRALKSKLRKPEDGLNPNEVVITGLRQEILDARLSLERCKQTHKEKLEEQQKEFVALQQNVKSVRESMEEQTSEVEKLNAMLTEKQEKLHAAEKLSEERQNIIESLKSDVAVHKDNISMLNKIIEGKFEEISQLQDQLSKQKDLVRKSNDRNERLVKELENLEELKEENQKYMEEIDELQLKIKSKKTKIKAFKKQISESEDQKEKLDTIAIIIPELQKKIDQLESDKTRLQDELKEQIQKEEDRIQALQQEREEKAERVQRERENWERRLLGIGECCLEHDSEKCSPLHSPTNIFHSTPMRPNSAPTMKPRPPSARRYNLLGKNDHSRTRTTPGRSFHPQNLNGVDGKRASEKVQSRQHRIIINGKGKERLFRSATLPADFTSSYTHINENNFFPKLKRKSQSGGGGGGSSYLDYNGNISPRVLVWGNNEDENAGKKLVAVGDRVSAKIYSDCNVHGSASNQTTGLVKFIGFIEDNKKDVYIGLRMDLEVGNTNGSVNGKRYFRCEKNRGKFVRLEDIEQVLESQTQHINTS